MAYNPSLPISFLGGVTASPVGSTAVQATGVGPGFSIRYDPTNLGTAVGSSGTFEIAGANTATLAIETTTTGSFLLEGSGDSINYVPLEVFDAFNDVWVSGASITPTLGRIYQILCGGYRTIRIRTVATLGTTVAYGINMSMHQSFLGGIDTGPAPHNFGYTTWHRDTEVTTAQTGAAIYTSTTGKRFAVTDINITTGGVTAGVITLWQGSTGDTTYTVGTDPAIFRGEFAPSATVRPGALKTFTVPYIASTVSHVLRLTTSANITAYIQVNGYEI
jgi:hypothetical protein